MKKIAQVCKSSAEGKTERLEEEYKQKTIEEELGKSKSTVSSEKKIIFKLQWLRIQ